MSEESPGYRRHNVLVAIRSLSFDDLDESELAVFSGEDLLLAHYDAVDLDWEEISERAMVDERRGLIIAQVAVLEDLVDEFLLYLIDPESQTAEQERLDQKTIGVRLRWLEERLEEVGLTDEFTRSMIADMRATVNRRNELAHGTISRRQVGHVRPIRDLVAHDIDMEWVLTSRKTRTTERITMAGLRADLEAAIGSFTGLLNYAEYFVEHAPWPKNYRGGYYLGLPTP